MTISEISIAPARMRATTEPQARCSAWTRLRGWHARWRERLALEALDDRLLRDIGLTREQVAAEIRKPLWSI